MEKQINLKTADQKKIFCIHNFSKKKNDTAGVFVHGFTGAINTHHLHNAARGDQQKSRELY